MIAGKKCYNLVFGFAAVVMLAVGASSFASAADGVTVPINRSVLVETQERMAEVAVANPNIADVVTHGDMKLSVLGKRVGKTTVRIFDVSHKVIRDFNVIVSYDLPAIRKALGGFFPDEKIGVELINDRLALTGVVSDAEVASKAINIANQFVTVSSSASGTSSGTSTASSATAAASASPASTGVMNLMQVRSGQQVMLRVRIGEIQRSALRNLGASLEAGLTKGGFGFGGGSGARDFTGSTDLTRADQNTITALWTAGSLSLQAALDALERNGLFKVMAEPNLVAISGERAEFLAGGEFPVPVAQGVDSGSGSQISIEFKQFGVAVQFMPMVLSEDRVRLVVQPEVSELNNNGSIQVSGFSIPALSTRRAKTTVELAPGESLMIAGLIKDELNSTVSSTPGLNEIPVLSSIFRGTSFDRTETELVISVTPYVVDPVVGGDIKTPADSFRPASVLEQFFYGSLSSLSGDALTKTQRPQLEGVFGFMLD